MYQYPALVIAHCLFWLSYAGFEHVSHLLYGQNHWQGSLWASLFIMLGTGALVVCYKKMQHSLTLAKSFALIFSGLMIVFIWHNLTRVLHNHISLNELLQQPILYWLEGSAYRVLLFFTWAGIYLSASNFLEKKRQQKELQLNKSKAKEAQLQLLMYQLNPHFLFNVLNSVDVAILEKNNDTAHNMLVKLSEFLRSTLEHKFQNKIPLKQELAILQNFVAIEKQRFHQNIQVNYDIESTAKSAYLPPLILQPLMENAIKFSWNLGLDCTIGLKANIKNKQLCLVLTNPLADNVPADNQGTNTGLENVQNRLSLLYGEEAKFNAAAKSGVFEVAIMIPLEVAA